MPKAENMTAAQLANLEGHKIRKGQVLNPRGRPRNPMASLFREITSKTKLCEKYALTKEQVNAFERFVLVVPIPELRRLSRDENVSGYLSILAKSMCNDYDEGVSTTADRLRRRQYGDAPLQLDLTTGGQPLSPSRMSDEEISAEIARIMKKMEDSA